MLKKRNANMTGIVFVHGVIRAAMEWLRGCWVLSVRRNDNPTCRLYPGATVDRSSRLGKHNVLFYGATLIDSSLGNHTFVQRDSRITHADVGRFCSIASGVRVGLGRHPMHFVSTHPAFYSRSQPVALSFAAEEAFDPIRRTTIGHDVWIGENVMVVDGISIGTGAVIGAGSVVTRDVAPYAVVAGVPARVLRFRFDDGTVGRLLQSAWWDWDEAVIRNRSLLFLNLQKFLDEAHHP